MDRSLYIIMCIIVLLSGRGNGIKLYMDQSKTLRQEAASFFDPPPPLTALQAQAVVLYQGGAPNLCRETAPQESGAPVLRH